MAPLTILAGSNLSSIQAQFGYAIIIERINAGWVVLDLFIVLFFSYYLASLYLKGQPLFFKAPLHVQAALAILVFHFGDMGVRFLVWLPRHEINKGHHGLYFDWAIATFAIIAGAGLICKLRVFSKPWSGPWVWMTGACVALLCAIITTEIS